MLADSFADFETVGIGQHNIEQDEIRALTPAQLDYSLSGLGTYDRKAFLFKVVLYERVEIGIVFDESYLSHNKVVGESFPHTEINRVVITIQLQKN